MKVKITIKGKAGQAGTLAEALDGFLKDELKVRAKYPEKTQYEIHVVQRTFYRTVKGSRPAKILNIFSHWTPSRRKGRGDTMDKTEALLMMIQALTLGIAIGFQIASMIYRRK